MDDWDDNEVLPPHVFETATEKKFLEFCMASQNGEIEKMKKMLEEKKVESVNKQSPKKFETALHYACRGGQLTSVKYLVENGLDVNLKDKRRKHGLHLACSGGYLDIVKYLIEKKSSLDFVDFYGRSCLHWAAGNKFYDIVVALLEAGAPVVYDLSNNWEPLQEAIKGGDTKILNLLIEKGAPVNPVVKGNRKPYTPLHIAAREGNVECLKILIQHKAMVNATNQALQTALHEAAYKGSKECCHQLILHGADPHAKNGQGRTPLLEACNQGHMTCAILLLDAGSFVNHVDRSDDTALHHLLRNNVERLSPESLASFTDILLQYGANPTISGREDQTPMNLANLMTNKDPLEVIYTSMEKPRSLLHIAKIACRKILRCDYELLKGLQLPRNLKFYIAQNTSYYSGW